MDTESMPAWTLPELLVVMILSGLIFLALSEATDLVGRFTGYLTERWVRTEGELSACHRLDELISRTDSIAVQDAGLQLYCRDTSLAVLQVSDSLLCCDYRNRKDTLLCCVEKMMLRGDTFERIEERNVVFRIACPVDSRVGFQSFFPLIDRGRKRGENPFAVERNLRFGG